MSRRSFGARRALSSALGVATLAAVTLTSVPAPAVVGSAGAKSPAGGGGSASSSAAASGLRVRSDLGHDISPPLRGSKARVRAGSFMRAENDRSTTSAPVRAPAADPVTQRTAPAGPRMPSTNANFLGLTNANNDSINGFTVMPPDTDGAVGTTQYMEWINDVIAVYDKSGAMQPGFPVAGNALFAGFHPGGITACQNDNQGDPIVMFDQLSDRWFASQFAFNNDGSGPYYQCVAVSATADATGSWYRYVFLGDPHEFNDYGKAGIWPDGYYMTFNDFTDGDTNSGAQVIALDRRAMLAGRAATMVSFGPGGNLLNERTLLPSTIDGTFLPPPGTPDMFIGVGASNTLREWKFHVDWTTPANSTFTGATTIPVASFDKNLCNFDSDCLPQLGTAAGVDALSDRAMWRLVYRNFGDHEAILLVHTVDADGSDNAGLRWYEIRDPNGAPVVYQQSTFFPDSTSRFMPSIAFDHDGNIAMVYSATSSAMYPSVWYTGRLAGDTLSQMTQGEATLVNGGGAQSPGTFFRWGDYSTATIDPTDDCTFWVNGEYYSTTSQNGWSTRIGSFKFPTCNPPAGFTNPSLTLTPTPGSWITTSGNTIDVSWNPLDAVSPNAPQQFAVSIDNDPHGIDLGSTLASNANDFQQSVGDGVWYVHFAIQDTNGTWGPVEDSGPVLIDSTPPTNVRIGGSTLVPFHFQKSSNFVLGWGATDTASGIDHYSVQYRTATYATSLSSGYTAFANTASSSRTIIGSFGSSYCYRLLAVNGALLSAYSAYTSTSPCTAVPLKMTQLSSTGFVTRTSSSYFGKGYKQTTTHNAKLTRSGANSIKHLAIIAYECPTCGVLDVYIGSFHVGAFNLRTSSTHQHVLLTKSFSAHSGVVTLKVTSASGKLVKIEAVGLSRL